MSAAGIAVSLILLPSLVFLPETKLTAPDPGDRCMIWVEAGEEIVYPEPETVEPEVTETVTQASAPSNGMHLWGVATITHYCPCSECCGAWAGGHTASGTVPTAGRTVACGDLPFGTRIMLEGHEYVVEDRGVGGAWIDVFVDSHAEALARGMYSAPVYIID